jgi:hypothetical protein
VSTSVLAVVAAIAVLLWPFRDTTRVPPMRRVRHAETRWSSGARWSPVDGWSSTDRWPPPSGITSRGRLLDRLVRRRHGATPDPGDVADALVLLALALRAGLGLAEALHEVRVGSRGRVRRDLASVVAALQWAKSAPEAWAFATPVWRQVAQAWEVAVETGSAPAEQVELVAQRLRDAQERDREQSAARAGVLLVLPLGLGFLPAFVCTAVVPVVLAVASGVVGGRVVDG